MEWDKVKADLLKDPGRRKAYNRPDPIYWLKNKCTDLLIWWKLRGKQ